jgi:hypothetical protein
VTVHAARGRGKQGPQQQAPARGERVPTQVKGSDAPMQLSRLWREHLAAGCPNELAGVEIAGTDARVLDAEITACVSALLTRTITVDGRIERRLNEISSELLRKQQAAQAPVAQYCARLNKLVSAVLVESKGGHA